MTTGIAQAQQTQPSQETHQQESAPAPGPAQSQAPGPVEPFQIETSAALQPGEVRIERMEISVLNGELELDVLLRFDLPRVVQDALLKGLPLVFVAEAELHRERWWWFDKSLNVARRQMRLSYQPLTQQWRLSRHDGDDDAQAQSQSFDTLEEVMEEIGRIEAWRVSDSFGDAKGDDPRFWHWRYWVSDGDHRLEFRFFLDTGQLPRPLQIGALGGKDWTLEISVSQPLKLK